MRASGRQLNDTLLRYLSIGIVCGILGALLQVRGVGDEFTASVIVVAAVLFAERLFRKKLPPNARISD